MNEKKDFLSSLADELDTKNEGAAHDDFEIYHASSKSAAELRNFKDQDYDFAGNNAQPKTAPKPTSTGGASATPKATATPTPKQAPKPSPQTTSLRDGKKSPHSFQQEELKKIEKKPFKLDPKILIAGIIGLIAIIGLVWFFFFAPKIPMPDFVGKTINDVGAWAKQNNIDTAGIIINTEYSLEYDKDVIISQDKKAGSKIKSDTALTFVASKGADPDEVIAFPDLMNMTYSEIKDWIDTNKLQKTKINTQYNTLIEKDLVINYDLKTGTESNFTRGSTLTINISKGPAPAGTVAIENFVGKPYAELEQWANTKKILLEKTEAYSDTVEVGKIISQNIKVGESLEEGGKLGVVVSKGKAVKIPNLIGYTKEMLDVWAATPENKVTIVKKERYNSAPEGTVIGQSLTAGTQVDQGTVLELTISLYMPQLETNSRAWYGKDYLELIKWVDDANGKGANLAAGSWAGEVCSDEYKVPGQIIEYTCLDAKGNQLPYGANGCARPMPLDSKISMKTSSGPCTVTTPPPSVKSFQYNTADNSMSSNYEMFKALCTANGVTFATAEDGALVDTFTISNSNGTELSGTITLKQGDSVIVKIPVQPTPKP